MPTYYFQYHRDKVNGIANLIRNRTQLTAAKGFSTTITIPVKIISSPLLTKFIKDESYLFSEIIRSNNYQISLKSDKK